VFFFIREENFILKKTLIICAMDNELEVLLKKWDLKKVVCKPFLIYKYKSKPLYATVSGVGKVNAATNITFAIERVKPDQIIGIGVAGGVAPEVKIGDVVICDKFIQHDMDVTAFGYDLGQVPGFSDKFTYSSKSLVKLSQDIAKSSVEHNVHTGAIMSGDSFIKDDKGQELYNQFGGMCVDMESAAWAQAATLFDIPFVVIRSISDQADGSAAENFTKFLKLAVENLSMMIEKLINMKVN